MIAEDKLPQFGVPMDEVKGIVIHNTNSQKSARELASLMAKSTSSRATHFFVDDKCVMQMLPLNWSAFNTGKGYDLGNTQCISIEICSSLSTERYMKAQDRAVQLIRKLMREYGLTDKDIYFHRDFDATVNCPAQILKRYTKNQFINLLKEEKDD